MFDQSWFLSLSPSLMRWQRFVKCQTDFGGGWIFNGCPYFSSPPQKKNPGCLWSRAEGIASVTSNVSLICGDGSEYTLSFFSPPSHFLHRWALMTDYLRGGEKNMERLSYRGKIHLAWKEEKQAGENGDLWNDTVPPTKGLFRSCCDHYSIFFSRWDLFPAFLFICVSLKACLTEITCVCRPRKGIKTVQCFCKRKKKICCKKVPKSF